MFGRGVTDWNQCVGLRFSKINRDRPRGPVQQIFCTAAIGLTQIRAISRVNAREGLMENVRRYRALASLCRQQAAYRPLQNWELLGQAEHFEYLAEVELKAHFDACNAHSDARSDEAAAWETPAAA